MRAVCLIRNLGHYCRESFVAGLRSAGYSVHAEIRQPEPGDVLLIWNRYGSSDAQARRFEAAGASVLVAENGFFRIPDDHGRQFFALSRGEHHHGGARPDIGRLNRWPSISPWRRSGGHILVLEQRGIGSPKMASPKGWAERTAMLLSAKTDRPVRIRKHPGNKPAERPLAADLDNCHAVVVWSSCGGIEALVAGIPVFYDAPRWIAEADARPLAGADIERPFMSEFVDGLANAAANQWSLAEIESGLPFKVLACA